MTLNDSKVDFVSTIKEVVTGNIEAFINVSFTHEC